MFGAHNAAPLLTQPAAVVSAFSNQALPLTAAPITHLAAAPPTPQPFVANASSGQSSNATLSQIVNQPELNAAASSSFVTRDDLTAALAQTTNALRSLIYQNESVPGSLPSSGGVTNNIALSNRIDQLTGTTLRNITVNGVSGLSASDVGISYASTAGITSAQSSMNIAMWGDSLTAGNEDGTSVTVPSALSTLTGYIVYNGGVSAQTRVWTHNLIQ